MGGEGVVPTGEMNGGVDERGDEKEGDHFCGEADGHDGVVWDSAAGGLGVGYGGLEVVGVFLFLFLECLECGG